MLDSRSSFRIVAVPLIKLLFEMILDPINEFFVDIDLVIVSNGILQDHSYLN
jgi:hypothetical protein